MVTGNQPQQLTWQRDNPARGDGHAGVAPWAGIERAFYPPGFSFPQHRHEFCELFLVERGPGIHRVDGKSYPLEAGDLVFVHADLTHSLEATKSHPLIFINIAIRPELHRQLQERFAEDGEWPWNLEVPQPVRLKGDEEHTLAQRIAEIEPEPDCTDRLRVELILLEAIRLWRKTKQALPTLPILIVQVQRLLNEPEYLRQGPTFLADRLGCSRENLNRVIARHLGMTTTQLINHHRLDHAARLLLHGDGNIAEICRLSGLENVSHFHKLFRKRFGSTPAEFRGKPLKQAV